MVSLSEATLTRDKLKPLVALNRWQIDVVENDLESKCRGYKASGDQQMHSPTFWLFRKFKVLCVLTY